MLWDILPSKWRFILNWRKSPSSSNSLGKKKEGGGGYHTSIQSPGCHQKEKGWSSFIACISMATEIIGLIPPSLCFSWILIEKPPEAQSWSESWGDFTETALGQNDNKKTEHKATWTRNLLGLLSYPHEQKGLPGESPLGFAFCWEMQFWVLTMFSRSLLSNYFQQNECLPLGTVVSLET